MVLSVRSGVAAARNAGLQLATGPFVAFLDSDDLWQASFLSILVALLLRYPSAGVAFSGHVGIDVDDRVITRPQLELGEAPEGVLETPFERFVERFPFVTSGTLVRRSTLDRLAWFDERLPSWQDADLWLRLAKESDFAYTQAPLASYRLHGNNITSRRLDWYVDELRVRLRHLDDVADPAIRKVGVRRIQRAQVLLQEELLRCERPNCDCEGLLHNDFSPTSPRYQFGRLVTHGPPWLGRSYAAAIRAVGGQLRNLRSATALRPHPLVLYTTRRR
jgi:glycosyltransferase involved in cell wall biosynthesis